MRALLPELGNYDSLTLESMLDEYSDPRSEGLQGIKQRQSEFLNELHAAILIAIIDRWLSVTWGMIGRATDCERSFAAAYDVADAAFVRKLRSFLNIQNVQRAQ
jgi:hypothetical protein